MTLRPLLVSCLLAALPSFAQSTPVPGFSLEHLTPDPANLNSLVVSSGDGLSAGTLRLGLVFHYERNPLVYFENDQRVGALVSSRFTTHLNAAYGLTDWLELGVGVPFVLRQMGDDLTSRGYARLPHSAVGSPLVQGRFTLLRESNGAPLDLGLTAGLTFPLGSQPGFFRDSGAGVSFIPRLGAGHTVGSWLRVGAEVGAVLRGESPLSPFAMSDNQQVGSMLSFAATASTLGDSLRGELDARSLVALTHTGNSFEVLAGARYPFADRKLEAFVLAGPGFGDMPGTPSFRILGGLQWTPMSTAACVEGQSYRLSDCPQLDRDGDGVKNGADLCPEKPGPAALQGCPDKDDDGDGIPNLSDACPTQAGPASRHGCPVPDSDGDGIPDDQDRCPMQKGVAANGGCPAVEDSDGDGVPDAQDKCPKEKGPASNGGCPEPAAPAAKLESGRISISEKVNFEPGKATLVEKSSALLTQVANLLQAHPEVAHVHIQGHTDNQGKRGFNIALSQRRADAVKAFLVEKGIAASRLDTKGFGPDHPLASNDDAAGREQNRRVEFLTEN